MHQRAFSLVELSIVLVILGLLTGGILGGQALIRAAQLRAVSVEHGRWQTSVHTFRDKYFQLPGDMPNATAFFRAADSSTGVTLTCRDNLIASAANGTCNGDGNGRLDFPGGTINEWSLFWNHLANAGLIEGVYLLPVAGGQTPELGRDSPRSKLGSSGWNACYTNHGNYGRGDANMFTLGKAGWTTGPCGLGMASDLTPTEAWNIDTKMDDGQAGNGMVTAEDGFNGWGRCASAGFGWTTLPSNYVLTESTPWCRLFFKMQ